MPITLYAHPYDNSARGFYFETVKAFHQKADACRNDYGDPVEEFELQFIDGDAIDCALAKAWGINQANVGAYLKSVEAWTSHDKEVFIVAVGEVGYDFDPETVNPSNFDIEIYYERSMRDLAEEIVAQGLFGDIPDHLAHYIDYDAIARDLSMDYTETDIAGQAIIYRAS